MATKQNEAVGPGSPKRTACDPHKTLIEESITKYHTGRQHLCCQYTTEHGQMIARHTRELAKLNAYIDELISVSPKLLGPPQVQDESAECPRARSYNQRPRPDPVPPKKFARSVLRRLSTKLSTRLSTKLTNRSSMRERPTKPHLNCHVCWECQRAMLLMKHNREIRLLKMNYAAEVRKLYDDNVVGVCEGELKWTAPELELEGFDPTGGTGMNETQKGIKARLKSLSLWLQSRR
ncbi:hypothetical protein BJ170DRAFT_596831 [Xylariales sp. AK1849]|nr:hypothetical protein BJ170DRAFT_596831 [Xylariales sp. AK1849]